MNIQTINRDGKPEYVVLPWADYQALFKAAEDAIDGALLDAFSKKLASGEDETVPAAVLDALLAGAHPVKVWREYRGLTQGALAAQAVTAETLAAKDCTIAGLAYAAGALSKTASKAAE